MSSSPNGDVLQLRRGTYAATVTSAGATLAGLTHNGEDLILPFDADTEIGAGYQGRSLAPWPNRIAGATYSWAGQQYLVACNEPATGAALHGLSSWVDWRVVQADEAAVSFALRLPASEGYPFAMAQAVRYALGDDGLTIEIQATNLSAGEAPVGVSTHPYLTCGVPVDECTLLVPADDVLAFDEQLATVGLDPVSGPLDLRAESSLDGVTIDHAYAGLRDGVWAVDLQGGGRGVRLSAQAPWVQVYTGEKLGRRGVAVEPMTCPPNAFNDSPESVATPPGGTCRLRLTIGALPGRGPQA